MDSFKTAWQVLMSPFACVAWIILAAILMIGWGPKTLNDFVLAWNGMFDEPKTGGPLPPDPMMDDLTESGYTYKELGALERRRGEGIG